VTSEVTQGTDQPQAPLLRVVNPDATPEEIAALVAVFASLGGGEAPAPRRRPEWSAPHRQVRRTLPQGPGGWRASSLPR
jgi:Acyl-CoA carboxylase epsilon subunit